MYFLPESYNTIQYFFFNKLLTLSFFSRLVLSVMPLPLTGVELEDAGVGLEIFIGNNYSALRYGNKDKPDYESTHGILKSTEFTKFYANWHEGFLTFGLEGEKKPIFLAEFKTKNNLLGYQKNKFRFYSAQGSNVLWHFPFCLDDYECDVHTTTGKYFEQFWPMREHETGIHSLFNITFKKLQCIVKTSAMAT